jgi:UDP-glucose 4-epimerase
MTILVTGGAGFIGASLVRHLLAGGVSVRVFDTFDLAPRSYLQSLDVELLRGDIRDTAAVGAAMDRCTAVVHLAAQSGILPSLRDPKADFDINVGGTLNVLEAARAAGVERFVFASSNAALGRQQPPASEEKAPLPISPYGAAKLAGEGYCTAYHAAFGLQTVALRFANVYGPWSAHKSSAIAAFFKAAVEGAPITIDGDGRQTRDFVNVDDLCRAILASLHRPVGGETFQIAAGQEVSIEDLAALVREVVGHNVEVTRGPARSVDVRRIVASVAKARTMLDWEPTVELRTGLETTWRWFDDWFRRTSDFNDPQLSQTRRWR